MGTYPMKRYIGERQRPPFERSVAVEIIEKASVEQVPVEPAPAEYVTSHADGRLVLNRSLADRINGGKVNRRRRRRQSSVAHIMRQLESSPLKRALSGG